MGFLDKLKQMIAPKAKELGKALGLDAKTVEMLEGLVEKLDGLGEQGGLDELATNALAKFKPALQSFKANGTAAEAFLEKAKAFLGTLSKAQLPDAVKGLVQKAQELLGKAL